MVEKEHPKDVEHFLSDTIPSEAFWINNGQTVRNIYELASAIEHMNDDLYRYHAGEEKNDFSAWIRNSLHDTRLADRIVRVLNRKKAAKLIRKRIKSIETAVHNNREVTFGAEERLGEFLKELITGRFGFFVLGIVLGFLLCLAIGLVV